LTKRFQCHHVMDLCLLIFDKALLLL
jgi:hypothetical protein